MLIVLQCYSFKMVEVFSRLSFRYCWCNGMTILLLCCGKVVTCLDEVDETYERTYAVTSKVYLHDPSFPNNDDPNGWKDREMMPLIFRWLRVMMFNLVNIMLMALKL